MASADPWKGTFSPFVWKGHVLISFPESCISLLPLVKLSCFKTEVITDEDFGPCPATAETVQHNTQFLCQFNKQRKEMWSISQRDYGLTQDQSGKRKNNDRQADILTDNCFSPGIFFFLSFPSKRTEKNEVRGEKKLRNDFSLHLQWHKVTYVMARTLTLIKMICPPKFREDFNCILWHLFTSYLCLVFEHDGTKLMSV